MLVPHAWHRGSPWRRRIAPGKIAARHEQGNGPPAPGGQQVENYLREQILSGALAPATQLPATRQLAQELGISRITVNNAYATLESEGLLYSRGGSGTFVLVRPALSLNTANNPNPRWPLWQQAVARPTEQPYERQRSSTSHTAKLTSPPVPLRYGANLYPYFFAWGGRNRERGCG